MKNIWKEKVKAGSAALFGIAILAVYIVLWTITYIFFYVSDAAKPQKGRVDVVHCSSQRIYLMWVLSGHKPGHIQYFRSPAALPWPKGCFTASLSPWLQHPSSLGPSLLRPARPSQKPSWGWEAASTGAWPQLGFPPYIYLYVKKWQWIMSLVTSCLWSGSATGARVQKSETEGREMGSQDSLCSRAARWSSRYALGACFEVPPSFLAWHISSSHGNELSDSQWWQSLLHKLTIFYSVAEQRVSTKEIE